MDKVIIFKTQILKDKFLDYRLTYCILTKYLCSILLQAAKVTQ